MRDIEFHENIRLLASFDIKNMYTNIPTVNLKDIIISMLDHNHTDNTKKTKDIIKYCNIILYENFFQHRDRQNIQTNGCIHLPYLFRNIPAIHGTHYLCRQQQI